MLTTVFIFNNDKQMNSNNNYRKVFSYHNFPFIMTVAAKLGSNSNINKRNEIRYHFAGSDGVLSE